MAARFCKSATAMKDLHKVVVFGCCLLLVRLSCLRAPQPELVCFLHLQTGERAVLNKLDTLEGQHFLFEGARFRIVIPRVGQPLLNNGQPDSRNKYLCAINVVTRDAAFIKHAQTRPRTGFSVALLQPAPAWLHRFVDNIKDLAGLPPDTDLDADENVCGCLVNPAPIWWR